MKSFNIVKVVGKSFLTVGVVLAFASCQKMDRPNLGDYPKDTNPPGGPLKFYVAFNGSDVDSIRANYAIDNPLGYTEGVNGQALQGEREKAVKYGSANDFASSTSFTIAFWMKHTPHEGGAEFVYGLPSKDFWHKSALFMLIEDKGQSSAEEAAVKFGVNEQWFEFVGDNKIPGLLDGQWHHMAIVYDETTSKLSYYKDGLALTGLAPNLTDVKKGDAPMGPMDFSRTNNFVIGGWNKHAGVEGPGDGWILSYSGALDQFRLYGVALNAAEVKDLFDGKK